AFPRGSRLLQTPPGALGRERKRAVLVLAGGPAGPAALQQRQQPHGRRAPHSLAPRPSTAACPPSCSSRCPAAAPMATWWCGPWGGGPGAARPPSAGSGRR
ncbi:unnamed protein product, partial [Tetraodon nigroviridis]